jgi:hypothetical protein
MFLLSYERWGTPMAAGNFLSPVFFLMGSYALNELPHPQVDFTFGLLNLNPDPSRVST